MNQILDINNKLDRRVKLLFIIQFYFSFILIIVLFLYWLNINKIENESKYVSNVINSNAKLYSVFNSKSDNIYFGKIIIDKINLEYFVYEECTEELLKILPCKYSGPDLEENGNICILGHNYFNDNFFSNLNKLVIGDEIIIESNDNKIYKYKVYEKIEIYSSNIKQIISPQKNGKILTLCTCTINRDKRLVIRGELY